MFGRILRDLTLPDLALTGGPLILAVLAFVRAARVDAAFDRWAWIAVALVMLAVCAGYLIWVWRNRRDLRRE
ncbi:hypothetical protein [Actinoplanes xinjiangensis]|uniref:hypothetical protein n=1 Tax=Actinoplanes xinjiangensis TaxID=512350 RepID=UPI003421C91E